MFLPRRVASLLGTAVVLAGLTGLAVAPGQAAPRAVGRAVSAEPLEWVALGDSYSAGVIEATGDEFETPRDGCARTVDSYPEVLRRELGPLFSLRNVTCGAARTVHIADESHTPLGRPLPPAGGDPDAPFAPVPPQIEHVGAEADLLTVGIGGNSAGFGEILTRCLALGALHGNGGTPCKDEFGAGMSERLAKVRAEYADMLGKLRAKAPSARIITVGYPAIFPEDATRCTFHDLREFSTITHGDLEWARTELLEALNRVIEEETAARGDTFADLYEGSRGHSVCDRAGGENWTDGILSSIVPLKFALVHPNARGQEHAARVVEEAILG
ncbi:SGNH/GDSL hydrolase family protein [Streptomyces sp. NPDC058953]|uniref:SGNH/GDSL hydrolase family protein n=1 Tax=unclassified Streptomyces TaxID=2593676 RepID=UPI0036B258B9